MDTAVDKAVKISVAAAEICEVVEKGCKSTDVVKIIGRLLAELGPAQAHTDAAGALALIIINFSGLFVHCCRYEDHGSCSSSEC